LNAHNTKYHQHSALHDVQVSFSVMFVKSCTSTHSVDDERDASSNSDHKKQLYRERNRIHARSTRKRKREKEACLKEDIKRLRAESAALQRLLDEQETVASLLDMQTSPSSSSADQICRLTAAAELCLATPSQDFEALAAAHTVALASVMQQCADMETDVQFSLESTGATAASSGSKRSTADYTTVCDSVLQRRLRNRVHAARTRRKRLLFVQASEAIVGLLQASNAVARERLRSSGVVLPSTEEVAATVDTDEILPDDIAELWQYALGKRSAPAAPKRKQQQQQHAAAVLEPSAPPATSTALAALWAGKSSPSSSSSSSSSISSSISSSGSAASSQYAAGACSEKATVGCDYDTEATSRASSSASTLSCCDSTEQQQQEEQQQAAVAAVWTQQPFAALLRAVATV
jgi:hypothetical protein